VNTPPDSSMAAHWNSPAATIRTAGNVVTGSGVAAATAPDATVDAGAVRAPHRHFATRRDAEAHAVAGGNGGERLSREDFDGTRRCGRRAVLGWPDGTRPLPSPPQPITLPLASSASVWSRPHSMAETS
jgi:hypothetical protein